MTKQEIHELNLESGETAVETEATALQTAAETPFDEEVFRREKQAEIRRVMRNKKNGLDKKTVGEKIVFIVAFAVFTFHSITLLLPVLWMFVSSFKGALEYSAGDAFKLPKEWLWRNYIKAFTMLQTGDTTFFGMIFNSLWYTALATFMSLVMPCITGYVMSKYEFRGRQFIFSVAIGCMVIPIVGASASYMRTIAFFRLYDNPLYVVVTSLGGFGGSFLVYYGFFKSVSWAYGEAAEIDGAGPYTIFFRIMLPHATPILLTYAITGAIGNWNACDSIILYLPSYPTIASGLFEYQSNTIRMANYPVYFSGLIISMIPTLVLFSVFSGRIMTSLSIGGLKG